MDTSTARLLYLSFDFLPETLAWWLSHSFTFRHFFMYYSLKFFMISILPLYCHIWKNIFLPVLYNCGLEHRQHGQLYICACTYFLLSMLPYKPPAPCLVCLSKAGPCGCWLPHPLRRRHICWGLTLWSMIYFLTSLTSWAGQLSSSSISSLSLPHLCGVLPGCGISNCFSQIQASVEPGSNTGSNMDFCLYVLLCICCSVCNSQGPSLSPTWGQWPGKQCLFLFRLHIGRHSFVPQLWRLLFQEIWARRQTK